MDEDSHGSAGGAKQHQDRSRIKTYKSNLQENQRISTDVSQNPMLPMKALKDKKGFLKV
jgi:hypothetical protein